GSSRGVRAHDAASRRRGARRARAAARRRSAVGTGPWLFHPGRPEIAGGERVVPQARKKSLPCSEQTRAQRADRTLEGRGRLLVAQVAQIDQLARRAERLRQTAKRGHHLGPSLSRFRARWWPWLIPRFEEAREHRLDILDGEHHGLALPLSVA